MREKTNFRIVPQIVAGGVAERKDRLIISLVLTLAICLGVLNSGCAPRAGGSGGASCSSDTSAGVFVDEMKINEARFKIAIAERDGLLPSDVFWFAPSDDAAERTVVYGWNEAIIQFREPGSNPSCDFTIPNGGCYQCNFCLTSGFICNNQTNPGVAVGSMPLLTLSILDNPNVGDRNLREFINPADGCLMRPNNPAPPSFVADQNALYKLTKHHPCGDVSDVAKLETSVIGTSPKILKPMDTYSQGDSIPRFQFSFKIPGNNDRVSENFSPHLKVTKVRVLLGKIDPMSGKLMMPPLDDNATLQKMRPSRIMFLRSVTQNDINSSPDESTQRCYVDAAKTDGDFNLQNCRTQPFVPPPTPSPMPSPSPSPTLAPTPTPVQFDVTPTFLYLEKATTLTWVIEYKLESGLTEPLTLDVDEVPVLEWTIE